MRSTSTGSEKTPPSSTGIRGTGRRGSWSTGGRLLASACGFHYVMEDLVIAVPGPADGLLVFRNQGQIQARGVELALRGRWEEGLQSRISYSYVESEDETFDEVLVNSPRHLARLNLIKPLVPERLFAGLEVLYESRARTLSGDYADDFALTNLTLTYVGVSRRREETRDRFSGVCRFMGTQIWTIEDPKACRSSRRASMGCLKGAHWGQLAEARLEKPSVSESSVLNLKQRGAIRSYGSIGRS